jgi:hypothetical protein
MAFDSRFAEYFDFTEDDLIANRVGQISPRQKDRLGQEDTLETLDLGCALFILLAMSIIGLAICGLVFNIRVYLDTFLSALPFLLPIGLLVMGIILYVNHLGNRERRQKYPMPVSALRGEWSLEKVEGRSYDRHYVRIDGLRLKIPIMVYDILRGLPPQTPLVVYIQSVLQKIVAMEFDDAEGGES